MYQCSLNPNIYSTIFKNIYTKNVGYIITTTVNFINFYLGIKHVIQDKY